MALRRRLAVPLCGLLIIHRLAQAFLKGPSQERLGPGVSRLPTLHRYGKGCCIFFFGDKTVPLFETPLDFGVRIGKMLWRLKGSWAFWLRPCKRWGGFDWHCPARFPTGPAGV